LKREFGKIKSIKKVRIGYAKKLRGDDVLRTFEEGKRDYRRGVEGPEKKSNLWLRRDFI